MKNLANELDSNSKYIDTMYIDYIQSCGEKYSDSLAYNCYSLMFRNCTPLTSDHPLPYFIPSTLESIRLFIISYNNKYNENIILSDEAELFWSLQ